MPKTIDSFKGEHGFLSNFYSSPIIYKDTLFPHVEGAFQAAKCAKKADFLAISEMNFPNQAKKAGQSVKLREDWEDTKRKVMLKLVRLKFEIPALRIKLLETGNAQLVEGNFWNDTYWGVCKGEGKNYLGKILMKVRDELR